MHRGEGGGRNGKGAYSCFVCLSCYTSVTVSVRGRVCVLIRASDLPWLNRGSLCSQIGIKKDLLVLSPSTLASSGFSLTNIGWLVGR